MTKERFEALDGLRGVVSFAVLCDHGSILLAKEHWLAHASISVDFFFLLGGFLLSQGYGEKLKNGLPVSDYMIRRVIRLYPMILFGVVFGAFASVLATRQSPALIAAPTLAELLTLPWPWAHFSFSLWPIDPPIWSLFWQVLATIAFGLWGFRQSTKRLVWLCALGAVGLFIVDAIKHNLGLGYQITSVGVGAARLLFSFPAGIILNRLHRANRLPRFGPSALVLAIALAAAILVPMPAVIMDPVMIMLICPAIVIAGANSTSKGAIVKFVGRLSYPLYLVHWPLLVLFDPSTDPLRTSHVGLYVAFVSLSLGLAIVALLFYDEPLRNRLNRSWRERLAAKQASPSALEPTAA